MPLRDALSFLVGSPVGWVLAGVWGALWGSFFNVAIVRIACVVRDEEAYFEGKPEEGPWRVEMREHLGWVRKALASVRVPSRSVCPSCGKPIAWYDNVPLVSWLVLGGRCRSCRTRISPRYLLVELAGVGLAVAVWVRFVVLEPAPPEVALARFLVYFFFVGALLVLTAIDLETMFLPDAVTYVGIPLFFVAGRLLPDVSLASAALGLVVGWGGLELLALGWRTATGREGLGGGDGKLMGMVGGLLGWKALGWTLFGAAFVGLAVSLPLLAWQARKAKQAAAPVEEGDEEPPITQIPVAFGPYLAFAAALYLFFGKALEARLWAWLVPGE